MDLSASSKIAVDVMGSDLGPREIILGVVDAIRECDNFSVDLVGDQSVIAGVLSEVSSVDRDRLSIVSTTEVIGMDEKPIHSLRTKKDSSMVRAIDLVRNGEVDVMLSCGNTGSLMAGSTLKLRTMEGVERPTLAAILPVPGPNTYIVLTDVGANPNTTPLQLVHNAILGSDYCKRVLGIKSPRIGLLTIGTEEGKGNELIQVSHEYLKKLGDLVNYSGLIEGFQIFENAVDVVVCDGFVGNILLKTLESLVKNLKGYIKKELKKNPLRMIGAVLSMGAFKSLKKRLNPETYGAASLLGLNGVVLKSHGSSNRQSIKSAVRVAVSLAKGGIKDDLRSCINEANQIINDQRVLV